MLFGIAGSIAMSGLLAYTFFDKNGTNDATKIQRIAARSGLTTKADGKMQTIQLMRRKRHSWGAEYVYRIPLGLSFADFEKHKQTFEDGLNHKRNLNELTLKDIRTLRIRADILDQIKRLLTGTKQRKEIAMSYDGTLKMAIYAEPLPEFTPFTESTLAGCQKWRVCVGVAREGTIYHDFDIIPHIVIAGTTTYGKSVFLKNIITTLIHHHPTVKLTLIDLKGGLAFNRFANVCQVRSVAKDAEESRDALHEIHEEMKRKQVEFLRNGYENIREARSDERHFIIIDEAAELSSQGEFDKEIKKVKVDCERYIAEIARIGGSLGYRVIFATQYPTSDTLPRQVKQNCDAQLCFRLKTQVASMVVLDEPGAEELPMIKGRAIYRTDKKVIVQTPFIENSFIDRIIKPHITIKPRKEDSSEHAGNQKDKGRSDPTVYLPL